MLISFDKIDNDVLCHVDKSSFPAQCQIIEYRLFKNNLDICQRIKSNKLSCTFSDLESGSYRVRVYFKKLDNSRGAISSKVLIFERSSQIKEITLAEFKSPLNKDISTTQTIKRWVSDIFNSFWDTDKFSQMLGQMQSNGGTLQLPSPLGSNEDIYCIASVIINGSYLIFKYNANKSTLILYQGPCSVLTWIYLLEEDIVVKKRPRSAVDQLKAINFWLKNQKDILDIYSTNKAAKFEGFLFGYPRPYHFIYDHLSGLHELNTMSPELFYNQKFYLLPDKVFISPSEYIGVTAQDVIFEKKMNINLAREHKFIIQIARGVNKNYNKYSYRKSLINYGKRKLSVDHSFQEVLSSIKLNDIIVWFGVCDEKRAWRESELTIVDIVNELSKKYCKVGVVFDGRTATIDQDYTLIRSEVCKSEVAMVQGLKSKFSPNVNVYDLVGRYSWNKILVANEVDFFLTNMLTDSMYVAKIACKPGLAFGANVTFKELRAQHDHFRTKFIPCTQVSDIFENTNTGKQCVTKVSVSINSEYMRRFFLNEIACLPSKLYSRVQLIKESAIKSGVSVEFNGYINGGLSYSIRNAVDLEFKILSDHIYKNYNSDKANSLINSRIQLQIYLESEPGLTVKISYAEKVGDDLVQRKIFSINDECYISSVDSLVLSEFKLIISGSGSFCFYDIRL